MCISCGDEHVDWFNSVTEVFFRRCLDQQLSWPIGGTLCSNMEFFWRMMTHTYIEKASRFDNRARILNTWKRTNIFDEYRNCWGTHHCGSTIMNYSTSWDSRNAPGRAICIFESLSRNPEHRKEILGGASNWTISNGTFPVFSSSWIPDKHLVVFKEPDSQMTQLWKGSD